MGIAADNPAKCRTKLLANATSGETIEAEKARPAGWPHPRAQLGEACQEGPPAGIACDLRQAFWPMRRQHWHISAAGPRACSIGATGSSRETTNSSRAVIR
jgi:hypothetical protein